MSRKGPESVISNLKSRSLKIGVKVIWKVGEILNLSLNNLGESNFFLLSSRSLPAPLNKTAKQNFPLFCSRPQQACILVSESSAT